MSTQEVKKRTRRVHAAEFKAEAVKLLREGRRKVAELARDRCRLGRQLGAVLGASG